MDERANEMSQISDREQLEGIGLLIKNIYFLIEPFSQQFSYPVQPNVPPTP
jgi:hypothetical protein